MPLASRAWSSIRQLVENPVATVVCFAFVLLSLQALPPWSPGRDSLAARLRDRFSGVTPTPQDWGSWSTAVLVRKRDFGFEVMLPDEDSWGDAVTALATAPDHTLLLSFEYRARLRGIWAFTSLDESAALRIDAQSRPTGWSTRDLAAARAAAVHFLEQRGHLAPDLRERLALADVQRRQSLSAGWTLNLLTLLAFLGFLWSLRWIPASIRTVRARRTAGALARRTCPNCGYPVGELDADYCPECGHRIHPAETT